MAAGISLVNVGITARLASRGQREQRRRDEERPIVARYLTLSRDAWREWWDASVAREAAPPGESLSDNAHWKKGSELLDDLRFELAQLDLLASRPVRDAADELWGAHEMERTRLMLIVPMQPGEERERRRAAQIEIQKLEIALLEGTRADLGLGPAKPNKSLLGMLLAAITGS